MRYTLLEMVQRILGAMDGDEVNTISDTTESLEVANIIKECYYDIVGEHDPQDSRGLFHLDSSGDNLKPTTMFLPENVIDIEELRYNIGPDLLDTNFRILHYKTQTDFFDYMNGLDVNETWVDSQVVTINGQDFNIKFRNDQSPTCWTSPDDRTILFDSYDSSYETTLTSSRTYGIGSLIPSFLMTDTFIPKLDPRHFQLLLQAAKAQAFVELKQTTNEKAERKERRNRLVMQRSLNSTDNRTPIAQRNNVKGFGR